jgi:threonyl-tRNA synthetase
MFLVPYSDRELGLKPMNCPGHMLLFGSGLRSYRDLPLRYAESSTLHRNERAGTLHGLLRVQHVTQDDAHMFVTPEQIEEEIFGCLDFAAYLYDLFGMEARFELSTRPENKLGTDEEWDFTEGALRNALERRGIEYTVNEGDGAFYGPKIEYTLKDALGRHWQLGTMQVDYNTAERLGGDYVTDTSGRAFPVMLHRAIVGSFERFIGILLEHHAGAMPAWLSPIQASVLNISENSADYAQEVTKTLQKQGLRVESDLRNEKITYKIREHSLQKVPYILVVGDKEKASGAVSVRARGNHDLGAMPLGDFTAKLVDDIARKA